MRKDRSNLQTYAMIYGARLGLFCTLSFLLYILGLHYPSIWLVFYIATAYIPFYAFKLAKKYRNLECEGVIWFGHACAFTISMFLFASLLVAAIQYIYFRFIDNGFFFTAWQDAITQLGQTNISYMGYTSKQITKIESQEITAIASNTPIQLVWELLSINFFIGTITALIVALFVQKHKKTN